MNFKKLLSAMALLLLYITSFAQTVTDANASMHATQTQGIFSCIYTVMVSDTNSISDLEIKLGTSTGSDNLFVQNIVYDDQGSLPGGWTYSRKANTITIHAGEYAESNIYFGEVRLKSAGSWSSPFQFIAN